MKKIIIILLILLAISSIYFKYSHCDQCTFEINDTKYNSNEFMQIYAQECLIEERNYTSNLHFEP